MRKKISEKILNKKTIVKVRGGGRRGMVHTFALFNFGTLAFLILMVWSAHLNVPFRFFFKWTFKTLPAYKEPVLTGLARARARARARAPHSGSCSCFCPCFCSGSISCCAWLCSYHLSFLLPDTDLKSASQRPVAASGPRTLASGCSFSTKFPQKQRKNVRNMSFIAYYPHL